MTKTGPLGLPLRTAHVLAIRRRIIRTAAGLALLLVAWLGFSGASLSTFWQAPAEGNAAAQHVTALSNSTAATLPVGSAAAPFPVPPPSAQAPLVLFPGSPVHAPAVAATEFDGLPVIAAGPQTEPVNPAALDTPAPPLGSPHVPFLQSAMAASRPGASHFGNAYGASPFAGGGLGVGSVGGGGAAVPGAAALATQAVPEGAGNERVGLLGTRWSDETGSGNSGSNDDSSNGGGSSDGGSNDSSNDGASGKGGSNEGGSNNSPGNGGSNGDGDGDSNDGPFGTEGNVPPLVGGPGLPEPGPLGFAEPGENDLTDNLGDEDTGEQSGAGLRAREVPEPASLLLTGLAIAGAFSRRARTRRG